jgi:hypothetical protein
LVFQFGVGAVIDVGIEPCGHGFEPLFIQICGDILGLTKLNYNACRLGGQVKSEFFGRCRIPL